MYARTHARTHAYTPFYGSLDFVRETRVEPVPREKFTHSHLSDDQWFFICFLHLLRSMASYLFNLHARQSFSQSLSKFSLVYLLVWHPPLHIPYITSPSHCLLFTAHTQLDQHDLLTTPLTSSLKYLWASAGDIPMSGSNIKQKNRKIKGLSTSHQKF